ncbi:MAG: hypothetical protein ABUS79_08510 [Pseudomonadota bacterium]
MPVSPTFDVGASDDAVAALAGRPDADVATLAALAIDEARLARAPAIAAAIYANPAAPLSVANQAVATCAKLGVIPEGIAGFEELAQAIAAEPAALAPDGVDPGFAELLRQLPEVVSEGEGSNKVTGRRSAVIDFTRLKLYEKIRLATLGNAYCRQNLLRDANRMVALAVIRSPQITDGEIAKAAANRGLSEDVIRYIANRKEMVKQYAVKLALVGNPKCPLAVALRLLSTLHADDLKQIARSKNVPGALSVAAKRLAAARGPQ